MQLGTELIKVIDHLSQKAGIAFDWSTENIIPYLQEMIAKVALYEKLTSLIWIGIGGFIIFLSQYVMKYIKRKSKDEDSIFITYVVFGIAIIISFIIIITQIFDIAQAMTLPEMTFYKYVQRLSATL